MTRFVFSLCLLVCAFAPAHAAPPTDAQIDRMLDTMDMRRTLDEMFVQVDTMSNTMGRQMLGEDPTAEQRAAFEKTMAKQRDSMRRIMSWDTLGPIYRKVYARLFTAEEVEAMIAFYGSDTGRSIMRKMPQAMQLSMEEMQPIMETMIAEMKQNIEADIEQSAKPSGTH